MSSSHFLRALDVTIPNGSTESNIIPASAIQGGWLATLFTPSSIGSAGTVTLEVNPDPAATAASSFWNALQQSGADVTAAAVNKAFTLPELASVGAFRLKAAVDPGADITYKLTQSIT